MKTTLIQEPTFTWIGSDLFCGAIFLCRLYDQGKQNGVHYLRLQKTQFSGALAEAGWDHWVCQPFELKIASVTEAEKLVESLYLAVFSRMEFKTTAK